MSLTFSTETQDAITIIRLQGLLNSNNAPEMEAGILPMIDGGARQLLLDFSELEYVSSAGLRVVLVLAKRLKKDGGQLVLCCMQPHVYEVFEISGFTTILAVAQDKAAALAQLKAT